MSGFSFFRACLRFLRQFDSGVCRRWARLRVFHFKSSENCFNVQFLVETDISIYVVDVQVDYVLWETEVFGVQSCVADEAIE